MRIGIQTWGTRGDVEPFFALARGLAADGHEVRVVVSTQADADLPAVDGVSIERAGVEMDQAQGDALFDRVIALRSPMDQARLVLDEALLPGADGMFEAASDLAADSDVIIRHHFLFMAQAAAMRAGIPELSVFLTPDLLPTDERPPTGMPSLGPLQRAAWWLADKGISRIFGPPAAALRERVGLPAPTGVLRDVWPSSTANLVAVSPTLCPPPGDWPSIHHSTGFWKVPSSVDHPIPEEIREFLDAGPPPLYASFGSMGASSGRRRAADIRFLTEAARLSNRRMVLQLAPGELPPRTDNVLPVDFAPHASVFPRCEAVIHHGGAGTTQTTIAAGVPSIVVPHIADQFFWAQQVERLEAGVASSPRARAKPNDLARSIERACARRATEGQAADLAARLKFEDGVASAVAVVGRTLSA